MSLIKKTDHFYLIDGSGYIFRAYYALPPLSRKSDGLPTGAVNGFCSMLFKLLENYFKKNLIKVIRNGIKVKIIGNKLRLASNLRKIIKIAENKTRKNKKISVQLALNYGSKQEIINSMKIVNKKKQKITIKNFEKNLYTSDFPDPDILIRTGGQKRLSNFLLWQIAYAEIFFVKKMWPDFNNNDFQKILNKFKKIKRNFGNI